MGSLTNAEHAKRTGIKLALMAVALTKIGTTAETAGIVSKPHQCVCKIALVFGVEKLTCQNVSKVKPAPQPQARPFHSPRPAWAEILAFGITNSYAAITHHKTAQIASMAPAANTSTCAEAAEAIAPMSVSRIVWAYGEAKPFKTLAAIVRVEPPALSPVTRIVTEIGAARLWWMPVKYVLAATQAASLVNRIVGVCGVDCTKFEPARLWTPVPRPPFACLKRKSQSKKQPPTSIAPKQK